MKLFLVFKNADCYQASNFEKCYSVTRYFFTKDYEFGYIFQPFIWINAEGQIGKKNILV